MQREVQLGFLASGGQKGLACFGDDECRKRVGREWQVSDTPWDL